MKDEIKELAGKIEKFGGNTQTEEATKAFFIAPFLKLLGYDVTSPEDVIPEFTADFGDSCNKVDYALLDKNNQEIVPYTTMGDFKQQLIKRAKALLKK